MITGTGGDGTSFVAALFGELGYDAPEVYRNIQRGNEWGKLREFIAGFHYSHNYTEAWDSKREKELVELFREAYTIEEVPEVVKKPYIGMYLIPWVKAGLPKPTNVILCMRDPYNNFKSSGGTIKEEAKYRESAISWGITLWSCQKMNIPLSIIRFPDMRDPWYTYKELANVLAPKRIDFETFAKAHKIVWRGEWVHHG